VEAKFSSFFEEEKSVGKVFFFLGTWDQDIADKGG